MMIPTATDEELHNMVGIICINAVGFDFKKEKMKGRALYPTLSVVSHSCISNTRFNGKSLLKSTLSWTCLTST